VQLTIIGANTQSISSNSYALPYRKKGQAIDLNFGQTIPHMQITIPIQATLTVTLTAGNCLNKFLHIGQQFITFGWEKQRCSTKARRGFSSDKLRDEVVFLSKS
jgi:hypothetical protein